MQLFEPPWILVCFCGHFYSSPGPDISSFVALKRKGSVIILAIMFQIESSVSFPLHTKTADLESISHCNRNKKPWSASSRPARPSLFHVCSFSQAESVSSRRHRTISFRPLTKLAVFRVKAVFPRESRFQRMYGPHVFRQTAGVCSRIMRNRARRTCTRDQLHSDLRNILYNGMCSQSSVCRHFLTCQQVANISSCAARCQLSVQLELSEHAQYRKDERHFFDEAYCEDRGSSTAFFRHVALMHITIQYCSALLEWIFRQF